MADRPVGSEGTRWLLDPPTPGGVHLHVAIGDETRLTPELRDALEGLLRALPEAEVAGYAQPEPNPAPICPNRSTCDGYGKCSPRHYDPDCHVYETCRINP